MVRPSTTPARVTCVIAARNQERHVASAIRSVLGQDYPAELLDVLVVDDGSTDATADAVRALEAESAGRVRLVSQPSSGEAAAMSTGILAAQGELIAILEPGDEWLPGKVRAQVEAFERPEVALVYGDAEVIDAEGAVIDRSLFARNQVSAPSGRVLDVLVSFNFTPASTVMVRAGLIEGFVPIPSDIPYAAYWIAVHAALRGELHAIESPLSRYRLHGDHVGFGVTGRRLAVELGRELRFRRRVLTGGVGEQVSIDTLLGVVQSFEPKARVALAEAGTSFFELVSVRAADRERSAAELGAAHELFGSGDFEGAQRAAARAWLLDPGAEAPRGLLGELADVFDPNPDPAPEPPATRAPSSPVSVPTPTVPVFETAPAQAVASAPEGNPSMNETFYTNSYYDTIVEGSRRSARATLPHLFEAVGPRSFLDVGCGVATWAGVARELGLSDVKGIDGDYVERARLEIPQHDFSPADLERPLDLGRRFDIVSTLEVAEHLAPSSAATFVETLTRHGDVILFSAAIPSQGGENHINEQWPEYWAGLFAERGFRVSDFIRPKVWNDNSVELWYAQNMLVFVRAERLPDFPALAEAAAHTGPLSLVHPRLFDIYRPWSGGPAFNPFA